MMKSRLIAIVVICSAVSAKAQVNSADSINRNQTMAVDSIAPPRYLDDVTVTARRSETTQFDILESVSLVTDSSLNERISRSVPEALAGTTGVWVQKTNHGGGSPILRGMVGNQILIMVDGIRTNNATYRYGPNQYLATIDPSMVEKIEVVRGSGSVLYGSDAIGGVVHVLTRTPVLSDKHIWQGNIATQWRSHGMEKSIHGDFNWSSKKFAILGGVSRRYFGDIVAGGSLGTLKPTGYDEYSANGKLLLSTGRHGQLTAAFQHHQQQYVPRYDQILQGGYSLYNFFPQTRQLAYGRWETVTDFPLLRKFRITAALNRSVEGLQSQKSNSYERKEQEDDIRTVSASIEAHSEISRFWTAQSGLEWYFDHVGSVGTVHQTNTGESKAVRGSFADGATSGSLAVFSNHLFELNNFQISVGGRFNSIALKVEDNVFGDLDVRPSAVVGQLGIAYTVRDQVKIYANSNTAFRAPNIDDVSRFGAVESTVFEIPSPDLAPEKSRTVEVGVKVNTKKINGTIAAYYTRLTDLITRTRTMHDGKDSLENRPIYQKQNALESEVRGAEASVQYLLLTNLSVFGNVTYTYGQNISANDPMRRIPPVFGRLGAQCKFSIGLWVKADYTVAGKQDRLAKGDLSDARIATRLKDNVMPGWDTFDLYLGWRFKGVGVSASLQNVFDEGYRVYASGVDAPGRHYAFNAVFQF